MCLKIILIIYKQPSFEIRDMYFLILFVSGSWNHSFKPALSSAYKCENNIFYTKQPSLVLKLVTRNDLFFYQSFCLSKQKDIQFSIVALTNRMVKFLFNTFFQGFFIDTFLGLFHFLTSQKSHTCPQSTKEWVVPCLKQKMLKFCFLW